MNSTIRFADMSEYRESGTPARGRVFIAETGNSRCEQLLFAGRHVLSADKSRRDGGGDVGPDPNELLLMAMGSSLSMALRDFADCKKWLLDQILVRFDHPASDLHDGLQITGGSMGPEGYPAPSNWSACSTTNSRPVSWVPPTTTGLSVQAMVPVSEWRTPTRSSPCVFGDLLSGGRACAFALAGEDEASGSTRSSKR
jgi:hypothetical protein